ncbi:4'-phosphopantetheinyl transferase superfamily protein [Streptomyces sp. NBC_00669]|uniref:4'-phosphopantetheinyl transferase family protein n=1 Tax=unclassified Streptomyces TaxID=2593676 RepID=UPI002E36D501|nr:4'-phosphopantetheinyl transferase superfamily protein [Streptomyces sp. NBC_00669]
MTVPPPATGPGLRLEAAPGIWVALHERRGACHDEERFDRHQEPAPHVPPTREDLAAADGLPPWRAAELLAGRGLLRALLRARYPEAAGAPVVYEPGGRPALAGRPRIGISISHDRGAVAVCAALDRAVGVDVQHVPAEVRPALLRRCTQGRAEEWARLPAERRTTEFAWLWTVQEACVKAEGSGFAGRPWRVRVRPAARAGSWGRYCWVSLRDRTSLPLSVAYGAPAPFPIEPAEQQP